MATGSFGIIAPHPPIFVPSVGGDESRTAHESLDALAIARDALAVFDPDTIVLMSPHAPAVHDTFLVDTSNRIEGSLAQFGDTRVYSWPGDPQFAEALVARLDAADIATAPRAADERLRAGWLDHATIVPLSYLDPSEKRKLVILSLSFLSLATHRELGRIVRETADELGRRVAFIASGDCSHRLKPDAPAGFSVRGAEFDAALVRHVRAGTLSALMDLDANLIEAAGECGLRSFITLGGFTGPDPVPTRVLSYEGPWGVGYLTALVGEAALDAAGGPDAQTGQDTPPDGRKGGMAGDDCSEIVTLARAAIESWVRHGTQLVAPQLSGDEYPMAAGAFVSLHRDGDLRGCIGTIAPMQATLAEEVAHNAIEAAVDDPRFAPLTASDLADLDVKVDVLSAPESCLLSDLDPARYGVIVTSGRRRGLLLPDLEGVDDVPTQVAIAMRKAGIALGESCDIERFRVERYT